VTGETSAAPRRYVCTVQARNEIIHNQDDAPRVCRQAVRNEVDCVVTIVADGSTAGTLLMAQALAGRYAAVSYTPRAEAPPSSAANRGMGSQDSVFVVWLDADDRIGPREVGGCAAVADAEWPALRARPPRAS
jgi:Glycosyl transferase family 2